MSSLPQDTSSPPSQYKIGDRPPFLHSPGLSEFEQPRSFVDEGSCQIELDYHGRMCKYFFLRRHSLSPQDNEASLEERLMKLFRTKPFQDARFLFIGLFFRRYGLFSTQHNFMEYKFNMLLYELFGHQSKQFVWMFSWICAANYDRIVDSDKFNFDSFSEAHALFQKFAKGKIHAGEPDFQKTQRLEICRVIATALTGLKMEYESLVQIHGELDVGACGSTWLHEVWEGSMSDRWVPGVYDYGLNVILYGFLQRINARHYHYIQTYFPVSISPEKEEPGKSSPESSTTSKKMDDPPNARREENRNVNQHLTIFGVKGCGKTRKIFGLLEQNYGFYLLPGEGLPEGRSKQNDTALLLATIKTISQKKYHPRVVNGSTLRLTDTGPWEQSGEYMLELFIGLKFRLFKEFCTAPKSTMSSRTPQQWLKHQINPSGLSTFCCQMFEIAQFLQPRQMLNLEPVDLGREDVVLSIEPPVSKAERHSFPFWLPDPLYFCCDEIQVELDSIAKHGDGTIQNPGMENCVLKPLLIMTYFIQHSILVREAKRNLRSWIKIESGTALNLEAHDPMLAMKFSSVKTKADMESMKTELIHSFERVVDIATSWSQLIRHTERILKELRDEINLTTLRPPNEITLVETSSRLCSDRLTRIWSTKRSVMTDEDVSDIIGILEQHKDAIVSDGASLRGRYLWACNYMQLNLAEALEQYFELGSRGGVRIDSEANSKVVQKEATDELRKQLNRLRGKNLQLYQDICWLAIRADLLNKPTTFAGIGSAELVTLGFAMARSDWAEEYDGAVTIEEPLAITAVLEHINQDPEGQHELVRQMNNWLFMTQDSSAALGDISEYYLACAIDGVFRSKSALDPVRKTRTLSYLQKNLKLISKDRSASNNWSAPNLFNLEMFIPKKDPSSSTQKRDIYSWMRSIRELDSDTPRMIYPDTKAGPDLMFCLEDQDESDQNIKYIVSIQLKTGTTTMYDTIHTVDPNFWYIACATGDKHQKDNEHNFMIEELKHWVTEGQYRIFSLLVSTSKNVRTKLIENSQSAEQNAITKAKTVEDCLDYRSDRLRKDRCLRKYASEKKMSDDEKEQRATKLCASLLDYDYAYCPVGREETKDLFGDAFLKLLDVMKKPTKEKTRGTKPSKT